MSSSDAASGTVAGAAESIENVDVDATIAAWRGRGAHQADPVRFRFIEALARRAGSHWGEARRILQAKLARQVAAYAKAHENFPCAMRTAAPGKECPAERGPLADLVAHIARHALLHGDESPTNSALPELNTLGYFRSTWARLSAHQRLTQSLATVPENAGPLNSHHLVHRSLTLMRDLSPEYLDRFMSYVDTLLWLEQANGVTIPATKEISHTQHRKRTARGRSD